MGRASLLFFLIISLVSSGCLYELPQNSPTNFPAQPVESPLSLKVKDVLKDAPKEECVTLVKIFRGAASYCNSSKVANTVQLFGVFDVVQTDYGWDKKKYIELNKIIVEELDKVDARKPKPIEEAKEKLSKTFSDLAIGAELAAKSVVVKGK